MRGTEQLRTLIAPADPARVVPVPPPAVPATALIVRAEAGIVSYDGELDAGEPVQHVLIFEPQTGELLSQEIVRVGTRWVDYYALFLDVGWTDDPGPEPSPGS